MSLLAVKGMAHFAGSGPQGLRCHQCVHWTGKRPEWEGQSVKNGTCLLSKPLTHRGKLVPFSGGEFSCNKFAEATNG